MTSNVEIVRIGMLAKMDGRPGYLEMLQQQLREQERNGFISIVLMDDDEAHIKFQNPLWARLFSGGEDDAQ